MEFEIKSGNKKTVIQFDGTDWIIYLIVVLFVVFCFISCTCNNVCNKLIDTKTHLVENVK